MSIGNKKYFNRFLQGEEQKSSYAKARTQVWAAMSSITSPIQIQNALVKGQIEGFEAIPSLQKLDQYSESLFCNARNIIPKELMAIPEFKKARKLSNEEKTSMAIPLFETALKKIYKKYGKNSSLSVFIQGKIFECKARNGNAASLKEEFNTILNKIQKLGLEESFAASDLYTNMGMNLLKSNEIEESSQCIKKAVSIRKKLVRSPSIELVPGYLIVGLSYVMQRMMHDAENQFEKIRYEIENSKEEFEEEFSMIMSNGYITLSQIYSEMDKNEKSLELLDKLQEQLNLHNRNSAFTGLQDAMVRNVSLQRLGKLQEAGQILEKAITNGEKELGKSQALCDLYMIYSELLSQPKMLDPKKALLMSEKAIQMTMELQGEEFFTMPQAYMCKAMALYSMKNYNESKDIAEMALRLAEKIFDRDNYLYQKVEDTYMILFQKKDGLQGQQYID